jgi:putative tricarboxylic transport membrane protein
MSENMRALPATDGGQPAGSPGAESNPGGAMLKNVNPRIGELCIAAVLLALAAFVIFEGSKMPVGSWALPGPGYFPIALGIILAVVSVALLFRRADGDQPVQLFHGHGLITIAAVALVALSFERIGAIAAFAIFLASMFYLLAQAPWWKAIAFGLAGAGLTWMLFVYLLQLQLPGA